MDSVKVLTVSLLICSLTFHWATAAGTWGYYGSDDETHWGSLNEICRTGVKQSPIDVDLNKVVMDNIAKFDLSAYDKTTGVTLSMTNNGHNAQLDILGGPVVMSGGGFSGDYTAAQLHFHWGKTEHRGSEHSVNGKFYPMEMHIVHYKTSYGSLPGAISKSDGLAVLGFFFELSPTDNPAMVRITENLNLISNKDDRYALPSGHSVMSFLPEAVGDFYRYSGSLTTPPCAETVTWTLFTSTIKISTAQLNKFRLINATESNADSNDLMYDNFRTPQAIGSRKVYASFGLSAGARPTAAIPFIVSSILTYIIVRLS